jgi:hypothetical protein
LEPHVLDTIASQGHRKGKLFCPTNPVNHWVGQANGGAALRTWMGFWRNEFPAASIRSARRSQYASQVFPTKRRCALGLSAGMSNPYLPAAQTRTAQPELDPRDDA